MPAPVKQPAPRVHYMLKFIRHQAVEQKMPIDELCKRAGVSHECFRRALRGKSDILLGNMTALLNTVGYEMRPVARE